MIRTFDFLHLPYTRDLSEAGIACAMQSRSHAYLRGGGAHYERLRRGVAGTAVELAFRRYLSRQEVPFEVRGAAPFTEPDRYDVTLGGRRCAIQSFLIGSREQIAQVEQDPEVLLRAPALVPSDQHAATGHSRHDLYLFAFLTGRTSASQGNLLKIMEPGRPGYLIHVMPDAWKRPPVWAPLGTLVLKSDAEETQRLELIGQDAGRATRTCSVELAPHTRLQVESGLYSLAYLHVQGRPPRRLGLHAAARQETHLLTDLEWGNIWVDGIDIILTGYLSYEEFSRRASFLPAGSAVFQYAHTPTKHLAVPVSDLKPLNELFESAGARTR